jgi:2-polyprenyl-6-hydroxyphenyl methylase/3-demethylubiquinone-9 3-methyltransferase
MNSDCTLFTRTASEFVISADRLVEEGKYVRGELFVKAAKHFVRRGGEILDFGCGPGRIAVLLARSGFRVQGVDPAPGMLREAAAQDLTGLEIEFALIPEESPSLPGAAFDGVVCSSVIEYVPSATDLLAAFRETLRPNGILLLSYANRLSLWRKHAKWRYPCAPHLALQRHIWNFHQVREELRRAGFALLDGPTYFESPFDRKPFCGWLSRLAVIGTLGLLVARRLP